ncbi:hypothetical protein L7F22_024063 [Adiantum nelumboides]|nr:hypothetical protein [Adiantum nelumboides]
MATQNPFALLEEDENDDPAILIARVGAASAQKEVKKPPPSQQPSAPAKLPSKPPPPAQAGACQVLSNVDLCPVRESRADGGRGRGTGRGGGRGNFVNRDRGSESGYNRPSRENGPQGDRTDFNDRNYRNGAEYRGGRGGYAGANAVQNGDFSVPRDDGEGRFSQEGGRGRGRGRGRGFFGDGDEQGGRRMYDRRSGSGRGSDIKREGAGRGNWGVELDSSVAEEVEAPVMEKPADVVEKKPEEGVEAESVEKKEVEEEDKEMTLEEYEKVLAEKRRALESMKAEVRKVKVDADFASMQLVDKKNDEEIFLKLGAEKGKKKELLDKDEKAKKAVSINEFLRQAEGESTFGRRGRGGRGRGGDRGGFRGGFGGAYNSREAVTAPRIEDPGQFPTLGGK